ncbi:DUF4395 domain-containing protein [Tomitella fengzijianii]|uniref:DUF4395 domain-containing protein n=1 Tax=Tomitella fengzijianii TaxID=2597660 RepID=A0A516X1A5_9ACTN|nr:DUF4395 domain-containing protein [Tomitella fengzijianii]QDQ96865.1 DUF4395 domain-containing protein [Tomitella fengzijianii]
MSLESTHRDAERPAHRQQSAVVDVRGPRFAAAVTTVVLASVLLTGAWWLLAVQAVVFAVGAAFGPRRTPYGWFFSHVVAPRITPPAEREPVAPLRFAQTVGLVFAAVGVAGYAAGVPLLGALATALALFAALLNAAFGFCLGCRMYPMIAYLRMT